MLIAIPVKMERQLHFKTSKSSKCQFWAKMAVFCPQNADFVYSKYQHLKWSIEVVTNYSDCHS